MSEHLSGFSQRVIDWQHQYGRHGLPWQASRDPYLVWLSEIMLQQTQVKTVLAYFPRFVKRFPDVAQLAAAPLDDVMALWSGLGYYSRARNLHRCAVEVVSRHGGRFPRTAEVLATLPGVGRSTAAAIAAFCFGQQAAILDGNVKRVLTRALGFDADLSQSANVDALWDKAQSLLPSEQPQHNMPAYTQGLMDLGATVCKRSQPSCVICPLSDICVAARHGQPERYPVKTRRLRRSRQTLWLLHATDRQQRVWLTQRPERGIWAQLYCLPVYEERDALVSQFATDSMHQLVEHAPFRHVLTHRDLDIHVVSVRVARPSAHSEGSGHWFEATAWPRLGLPAPVRRFLAAQVNNAEPEN